jgi:hypothetical protein
MFKKLYTLIGTLGAFSLCFFPGFAYSVCNYERNVTNLYSHKVQSVQNFNKNVIDYIEGTRKCSVSMSIMVDNLWYDTDGSYVFGPHLSENEGCKFAVDQAKEKILKLVSPEYISGEDNMNCFTGLKQLRPVDLLSDPIDNKICKRVYFDATILDIDGKIWGYNCDE